MKFLKSKIKKWCKEKEIKYDLKIKALLDELEGINRREENELCYGDIVHKESLKADVATSIQMEEIS